ncbi:LpxI family protein [Holospora curviuscula]|uniref:UDP-2,3-diacylglucosamine pyrophosphatase LpxI n=1 Tax=Holospora curviuscula TaxID=1082868 RepID=A0A2S5R8L0_9PROT|nr:UDP-2,3-diacylglucosamine diphosphatase LpxI [Holospora curviuscula]PPE03664.1 hypothetical protein HCUR_00892 [Holospora curviuscula]
MQIAGRRIALVGGEGSLPFLVKDALKTQGWHVFVLAYYNVTQKALTEEVPHVWLSLGRLQETLNILRHHHIQHIALVGKFYRPKLSALRPDALARKLLYRLGMSWFGDDALLTTMLEFFQELGLTLVKTQDILPGLLTEKGQIGRVLPHAQALEDIQRGAKILQHISCWDIGQGLAIQGSRVLGIEAAEGTDACITRCGVLAERGSLTRPPVYVKMAKKDQSRATDLPVVGLNTVYALSAAGFQGMGIEAHSVLVLDPPAFYTGVQEHGVFLWKF